MSKIFSEPRRTSNPIKKKRIIDKDKDYYYEHVEDYEGKVIHHCEEPLSKHYNHGSAKKINDNSRKLD